MNRRRQDDSWSSMGMSDQGEPLNAAPEITEAPIVSKLQYRNDDVSVSSTATPRTRRLALFVARFDKMRKSPAAPRKKQTRREKFAKLASIESLDLASPAPPMTTNAGAYSRRSLEVNEDPNEYFEAMKKRAHERRSQSDSLLASSEPPPNSRSLYSYLSSGDSDEIGRFRMRPQRSSRLCHDTDTEIDEHQTIAESVAPWSTSGDYTVASRAMTESGIATTIRRKKKKKKRSNSRSSKHYYAQLCFDGGEAGVEYARIPNDTDLPDSSASTSFADPSTTDEGKNDFRSPVDLSVLQHDFSIPLLGDV